jgi:hypothetical protein
MLEDLTTGRRWLTRQEQEAQDPEEVRLERGAARLLARFEHWEATGEFLSARILPFPEQRT